MPKQPTHIIQRQTFLFNTVKHHSAYELQDKISRYCHHQLQDALEKLFDQIVNDTIFIRVEKLEINVGSVSIKNLKKNYPKK